MRTVARGEDRHSPIEIEKRKKERKERIEELKRFEKENIKDKKVLIPEKICG